MSHEFSKLHPDEVGRSLDELGQLLELAEQVSKDLDRARSNAFRQIGYVFITVMIIFLSILVIASAQPKIFNLYPSGGIFPLFAGGVAGILSSTYLMALFTMSSNKRKWRVERQIVLDILVMASSILDSLEKEIGSIEYTLFRMRMRRLSLSEHPSFLGVRFG